MSMTEKTNSTLSNINSGPVEAVKADKKIYSYPKMTDEEILAYTLEFERKLKI
jgi:hypothetical protein